MKTLEAAIGKWPGILEAFGMPKEFLQNRHGKCPLCGGKDRYRFDDKNGTGSFYCSGCGAGYGFRLLKKWSGKENKILLKEIDSMLGNLETKIKHEPSMEKIKARIDGITKNLIAASKCEDVMMYLRGRKISPCKGLFAVRKLWYFEGWEKDKEYPAMVAPFTSMDGNLVTYHVTYLRNGTKAPVESPKKIMTPISEMNGGSIRLTKIYPHIGIAEGIETALAVMRDFKIPCWAAANSGMMEKFNPPEGITKITVFGDNDKSFTGQKAAFTLAYRLRIKNIETEVKIHETVGDYADFGLA